MRSVTVREARQKISEMLDAAEAGEEIAIERRGRVAALLVPARTGGFESHAELRAGLPAARTPTAEVTRTLRDEDRA